MDQPVVHPVEDTNFQPAYVRALKTWHTIAGIVIVAIWAEALATDTLTKYLAFAAPIFGPGFFATAAYVHLNPKDARRGAAFGFIFFAGYFLLAYIFALIDGPWEYSFLIFSNAVWTSTIYLYASLFLGRSAFKVNLVNATIASALTIACVVQYVRAGMPMQDTKYGIQPYAYSLLAQWAMLLGAQVINQLYRAVRSYERQVAYLRQVVAEMVGHEIGTPMQSMVNNLGLLPMLIRRIPGAEAAPEALKKTDLVVANLHRNVEQIERVLANAAESSKAPEDESPTAHRDEVDLPHLLDTIIEDFRPKAATLKIGIHQDRSMPAPGLVAIDKTRVTQIVTNLLSNALKYSDSGEVTISCSSPSRNDLRITVTDTGIGIPAEALTAIFEPYVRLPEAKQRATTGSGLGLAVVKKELTKLQGEITVQSIHGQGSTFIVKFPALISNFVARAETPGPNILIVDDSEDAIDAAMQMLAGSGYRCVTAAHGGEAMERLQAETFDLVFMDIQMPVMDGYEVARRVRVDAQVVRNANVPIVGMSANMPSAEGAKLFNFFIKKPFQLTPELIAGYLVQPSPGHH